MFGRWLREERRSPAASGGGALRESVQRELPGADAETVTVVTSMVGLLGAVAYGGADIGEVLVTAQAITAGDYDSWYDQWLATADWVVCSLREDALKLPSSELQ